MVEISCSGSSSCPCPRREDHWVAIGEEGTRELLRRLDAVKASEDRVVEVEDILRQAYPVLRAHDMWSLVDRIDALKLT